jgi:chromate transporter
MRPRNVLATGSPNFTRVHRASPAHASSRSPLARVAEVLGTFAGLGMTSFGGPIAHLSHFRERCVRQRRWIDEAHYAQLVAYCHAMPGPTSSQVGFLLGWIRAGPAGAMAAWFAFTLPSAVVMVALAVALSSAADLPTSGWIAGMKAIVPAVVLYAVAGMARTLCRGIGRVAIAMAAGGITLAWNHPLEQLVAIVAGALLGAAMVRQADTGRLQASTHKDPLPDAPLYVTPLHDAPAEARVAPVAPSAHPLHIGWTAAIACAALLAVVLSVSLIAHSDRITPYVRAGALVFGGGHVVLPLLEDDLVPAMVDQSRFLAGYGAAQAIPGPLFTVASYLGASASVRGGDAAGTAALWGAASMVAIFAPGLLLAACAWPVWSSLSRVAGAMRALAGVQAAVTGLLAAALVESVVPASVAPAGRADLWLCAIAALAFAALRWGAPAWIVTVGGSLLGAAIAALR